MAGKFIVLEGLEGAGKSTAIQTVSTVLNEHGINEIVYTREPGGTPIAEQLRTLIKTVTADDPLTYKAELLMFYAARIQLVENIILPALKAGKWVIGDRHDLSTQAYQGGGRELPQHFLDLLRTEVLDGFEPDLTLYLDVPPTLGLERARARGKLDRIEQETLSFFERTRTHFLKATEDHPDKIKKIDASKSLDKVQTDIRFTLTEWLKHNANH